MTKTDYKEVICRMYEQGKTFAETARVLGISRIYVKKLTSELVREGIFTPQTRYALRADYKEVLRNGKKS